MLLNDAIGIASPARAFSDFLRRVERLEEPRHRRRGMPGPVSRICMTTCGCAVLASDRCVRLDAAARRADGLLGVEHDVQQRLLQQQRIGLHAREPLLWRRTTSMPAARNAGARSASTRDSVALTLVRRRTSRREPAKTSRLRTIFAARSASR